MDRAQACSEGDRRHRMAVQPAPAPVLTLTPTPVVDDYESLVRELETERSAGKALIAAVTELELRLTSVRETVASQAEELESLRERLSWEEREAARQRKIAVQQMGDLQKVRMALREELDKPLWRRVMKR
jgi:predicted  nucleic acid-binding Zn-ribbon protein